MSDAEWVEEIRKRVRLRERFGYSEIGYNGKTVFDAKDVPYLLDRLTACREREERLREALREISYNTYPAQDFQEIARQTLSEEGEDGD